MESRTESRVRRPSLLEVATEVLVSDPAASLADVARAAGIGRTTLHRLYPTRQALLVALARDALDMLERAYHDADLDVPGEQAPAALRRLAERVIPLGSRMEFLLRERSLDSEADLRDRVEELDEMVRRLERRARAAGVVRVDLPDGWITAALNGLVYAAWEQVASGRVAPLVAPDLVVSSLFDGVRPAGA